MLSAQPYWCQIQYIRNESSAYSPSNMDYPLPPHFYSENLDLYLCMIFQNPQPLLLTKRGRSWHYDWTKYDREDQWRRGFVEDLVLQHQSCKIQGRVAYWDTMLTPSQKISDWNPLMPSSSLWDSILLPGSWWPSVRPKKKFSLINIKGLREPPH